MQPLGSVFPLRTRCREDQSIEASFSATILILILPYRRVKRLEMSLKSYFWLVEEKCYLQTTHPKVV